MTPAERSLHVYLSASAAARLERAADVVRAYAPGARVLIVGASRGAADDFARRLAAEVTATFGVQRLSLTQLAARTAIVALAHDGLTPSTRLGAEAVAARAVFDTMKSDLKDQALRYFAPVWATPGFPRAVARTLQEIRLSNVGRSALAGQAPTGHDLAVLLDRFERSFEIAGTVDRAGLFHTAARLVRTSPTASAGIASILLLDVPLHQPAERELLDALIDTANRGEVGLKPDTTDPDERLKPDATSSVHATVPRGDRLTHEYFASRGASIVELEERGSDDLACLRQYLFTSTAPPPRTLDGSLEFFSAPGEGREAVEIARRILAEARRGVPFDEMAVFVRSPGSYFGLLEHALGRAGVPAWFDRGTRRPHPTGRAFLALLACAAERLSAARFAEYLSLGQVPLPEEQSEVWAPPEDDALQRAADPAHEDPDAEVTRAADAPIDGDAPVIVGTLRAPWRWERLLVEAAVIGGDAGRWSRRLAGKLRELDHQADRERRAEGDDSPALRGLQQVREQLERLRDFALPIVTELADWPVQATWGEWLDRFMALAPLVLRRPEHVVRALADLRPMAEIGPIDLDEARRVLGDRLQMLDAPPPSRRFGRVFVGTPEQARGRSFRVVCVPGLAERMFPQKPREDPLLLDDVRERVGATLVQQRQRLEAERLLLRLVAAAATERLYVSYPRIELSEARARVPSFYALDVMRAATGEVPDHEQLEEGARAAGNATLAWPAPPSAEAAIDDQEYDLAVLRRLLDEPDRASVRGHAHYLLKLNECLRRSVIDRWARSDRRWSGSDGLTRVSPHIAPALARQRLTERPYSVSALQKFSACPYQFVLSAFYRLQPMALPEPLQRLDPRSRGSLFHAIQQRALAELDAQAALPVTAASVDAARGTLDRVVDEVAERAKDEWAPAVDRVWHDEIASIRRDLHAWLDHLARDGAEWLPRYFEYGFGEVPGERDVHSVAHDIVLSGGFRLRGAIDLIEEHRQVKALRVTDHKTGRKPDRIEKVIVDGGKMLQPVLYAMVAEQALDALVSHGRLFYCTSVGSFYPHEIPLNERTRAAGLEVLQVIDRAIERGFLAAAPEDGACDRCHYRPVCGPRVERRVTIKPQDRLADLRALRERQ